jgi:hypothetical protein
MLIIDSPARLVCVQRDRDLAGTGGNRGPDAEAEIVVPGVAVGRTDVLWTLVPRITVTGNGDWTAVTNLSQINPRPSLVLYLARR